MTPAKRATIRCAIYTRKSSEEGLEQDFNSLDAQHEACAAYIKSQAQQGWRALPDRFDDGGQSGGTIERPALQRLLAAVQARKIDVIVLYKIDRLTRSLTDFARLAELFDQHGVSFVAVTQQFNTTTSMGRLMLNVLLSFAQFEREVTGERIRDKIAASKKKGLWMGGFVPLGYDAKDRSLVINEPEATTVRALFRLYQETGSVRAVKAEAERLGLRTKRRGDAHGRISGGTAFSRGHLYRILANPIYVGQIAHKKQTYAGAHAAIIDPETWQAVQQRLAANLTGHRTRANADAPSLLVGRLIDAAGNRFTPSHALKAGRRYRYYVERALITGERPPRARLRRIPADAIEGVVRAGVADLLNTPSRLLAALGGNPSAAAADDTIRRARRWRKDLLDATPATWIDHLGPVLHQVVVEEGTVRLRIEQRSLRRNLGLPADDAAPSHTSEPYDLVIPVRLRTRGVQLKLVVGTGDERRQRAPDPALIKAIARAQDWWHRLHSGEAGSLRDLATAEGIARSYIRRVLRVAFLAPDIVEAILDGRQPVELTAERLLRLADLPLDWREQRRRLGFAPA
ncbi:recombinase family protein [Rhodospirillaceae bacterium SYSU D60014]|uniref:recombinase family protein n=1 Tax=Virgifigura deserti TaxID=2268457 RepID=UPI000E6613A5